MRGAQWCDVHGWSVCNGHILDLKILGGDCLKRWKKWKKNGISSSLWPHLSLFPKSSPCPPSPHCTSSFQKRPVFFLLFFFLSTVEKKQNNLLDQKQMWSPGNLHRSSRRSSQHRNGWSMLSQVSLRRRFRNDLALFIFQTNVKKTITNYLLSSIFLAGYQKWRQAISSWKLTTWRSRRRQKKKTQKWQKQMWARPWWVKFSRESPGSWRGLQSSKATPGSLTELWPVYSSKWICFTVLAKSSH